VPVAEESLVVAVPDNHRFATRRQIALAELADEEFLIPSEAVLGSVRAFLIDLCKRAGFTPRITEQPSDFRLLLGLVSAGVGVTMLASSARDLKVRGVHYISIVPPIVMRFGAMYRRGATAKFLAPFLERIER
jgi:DNA-binding transcriptional LysR family regulator